jgi:membrane fusion protein (multidrug efflux system)
MGLGLLAGSLALAGCGKKPAGGPPAGGAPAILPEVAVVTMQPERVVITTELPGRTAPYLVAEIRPQVSGLIQKRLFTEGAEVQAGQELYRIDPAPFQAALDSAAASLARAEAGLHAIQLRAARFQELLADRAISQQDVDDASAAMKQAEAEIAYWKAMEETARIQRGYTTVRAPIAGRIGKSSVTEGALVGAYQPLALATIQQLDPIYLDVPQSTVEVLRLKRRLADGRLSADTAQRSQVQLILEDGAAYAEGGELQFSDVTVDPTTGSVILRAVFPNPDGLLLPGMFARAILAEGVNEQALLVPQQGVARTPKGDPYVLVVDGENKVEQRMLKLDRAVGQRWLVASGLQPGDRVIVEGSQRAKPGGSVRAVPFEAAPPAPATPPPSADAK